MRSERRVNRIDDDGLVRPERGQDRVDDLNVCESLQSGGLDLVIVKNTVRKVEEFGCKLVPLAERFQTRVLVSGRSQHEFRIKIIGRFEFESPIRAG